MWKFETVVLHGDLPRIVTHIPSSRCFKFWRVRETAHTKLQVHFGATVRSNQELNQMLIDNILLKDGL